MNAIYFKATWCSACNLMYPKIQKLQQEGYKIQVVDVDTNSDLKIKYKISSLPTLVLLNNTKEVGRIVGVVDIDEVRKQLKKDPDYRLW